jgi:SAM-dependent methyltransferase
MRKEYETLKRPLPLWHPKGIWYALVRALLSGPGNLSDRIRIGNRYGFDSGVMLDYVYKNRASGRGWIGRLIDRVYLNSVGWRGILNRKALTRDAIAKELRGLLKEKEHIDYLDIACGGVEYDLETIAATDPGRIRAELRDYRRENLDRARENAEALGLGGIVFRQADAFDGGNYPNAQLPSLRPVAARDYFYATPWRRFVAQRPIGILPIDRKRVRKSGHEHPLAPLTAALDRGEILIIYPEGSRGEVGRLRPFHSGFAHLARLRPEVPVVPVQILGTDRALPRNEALWVPFVLEIRIGAPHRFEGTIRSFTRKIEGFFR